MALLDEFRQGCTGVSWIYHLRGKKAPGEICCDEHDLAYEQGGSLAFKRKMDRKLYRCLRAHGYPVWAGVAWAVVALSPYSYFAWWKPEPAADRIEREVNHET